MRARPIKNLFPFRPGFCRLCDKEIVGFPRRSWHRETCLIEMHVATSARDARQQVFKRDKGKCAECGNVSDDWQADHIRPLWESNGDFDYFRLSNLQTLCGAHHKIKTKADVIRFRERQTASLAEGDTPAVHALTRS